MSDKPFRVHFYDWARRKGSTLGSDHIDVRAADADEARRLALQQYPEARIAKTKLFKGDAS